MENLFKKYEKKVFQFKYLDSEVLHFDTEVLNACKLNHCGMYNKKWNCPPAIDSEYLKENLKKYKKAFLFTTKHSLTDSFDLNGMNRGRKKHQKLLVNIYNELKLYDIFCLGAGSCDICKKCTYPNEQCRFPQLAFPSVEACGINVVSLASTNSINYHNGANTVTYFSLVLYNDIDINNI